MERKAQKLWAMTFRAAMMWLVLRYNCAAASVYASVFREHVTCLWEQFGIHLVLCIVLLLLCILSFHVVFGRALRGLDHVF